MFTRIGSPPKGPSKEHIEIDFSAATRCLEILTDVRVGVEDACPRLTQTKRWHRWGPGYSREDGEDGTVHYLAFGWYKRKKGYPGLYFGFYFPETESDNIVFYGWKDEPGNWRSQDVSRLLEKQTRKLDRDKLTQTAKFYAKQWHF
jgi:hypothetical protein